MIDIFFLVGILALVALVAALAQGSGETVIVFEIIAAVLAVAAIGLSGRRPVKPERF